MSGAAIGLEGEVLRAAESFISTEYTAIDAQGQPITWPVTPYVDTQAGSVDVTTGVGYPKKADDAAANPKVSLLFSDPTGATTQSPAAVLVQGDAEVDDRDLRANQDRYWEASKVKLPGTVEMHPPKFLRGMLAWYYARIYIKVRPVRALVWEGCDFSKAPEVIGSAFASPAGAPGPTFEPVWDARMDQLGDRYPSAVVTWLGDDGYPQSARFPVSPDPGERRIRLAGEVAGLELGAGAACLTAHKHNPDFSWQENFQVRGVLTKEASGWALVPRKMVGGFELPKESQLAALKRNFAKSRRFRKIYKERMKARASARA